MFAQCGFTWQTPDAPDDYDPWTDEKNHRCVLSRGHEGDHRSLNGWTTANEELVAPPGAPPDYDA